MSAVLFSLYSCCIVILIFILIFIFILISISIPTLLTISFSVELAVQFYLEQRLDNTLLTRVLDTPFGLEYTVPYGRYFVQRDDGKIFIVYENKQIVLRYVPDCLQAWKNVIMTIRRTSDLQKLLTQILVDFTQTCKKMIYAISNAGRWNYFTRKPRSFSPVTAEMQSFINDVDLFKSKEADYEKQGRPYRRGYMLHGDPGTGKSACGEIIAKKYNMTLCLLQLNAKNFHDADLITLVSKLHPNSILFVDEVDKQLDSIRGSNDAHISVGGFLSALDGPSRINHGCIVIMTSNKKIFLAKKDQDALYRAGRIDQVLEFKNIYA